MSKQAEQCMRIKGAVYFFRLLSNKGKACYSDRRKYEVLIKEKFEPR